MPCGGMGRRTRGADQLLAARVRRSWRRESGAVRGSWSVASRGLFRAEAGRMAASGMRHGGDSVGSPGGGNGEMSPAAWRQRVHEWEAATPPSRDRFMDATRVLSMLVVVAGHWLMAAVAVVDGRVSTRNILDVVPTLQPATWALQVMPLFFLAGGFSNAVAWRRRASAGVAAFVGTRLARLTRPALVFTVGAAAILTAGRALGAPSEQIALAGRFVGAP